MAGERVPLAPASEGLQRLPGGRSQKCLARVVLEQLAVADIAAQRVHRAVG